MLLDLIDNGLVLQHLAVVGEVDGLGRFGQDLNLAAGVVVTLLEGLERGSGLTAESKALGYFGPIEFESSAPLINCMLAGYIDSMKRITVENR